MSTDLLVVGGGPIGCMVAARTAGEMDTLVLEEHRRVGIPTQCAGLVTPRVIDLTGTEDSVLNRLRGARIHFPGGTRLDLESEETKAVVVDRRLFDLGCHRRAVDRGATILPGHRFLGMDRSDGVLARVQAPGGGELMRADMVVGADGHRSRVARSSGLGKAREIVRGIQVDLEVGMEDQESVEVHLGREVAPGFFAWIIPCGDFTRVGLCVSSEYGRPSPYLRRFLRKRGLADARRRANYSGVIPIGTLDRTYGHRVLLAGDAAGQIKPISGGGLYTGLVAAECAASTVIEAQEEGRFDEEMLSRYQERWRGKLGRELDRGYRLRRMFLRMSDSKLDELGRALRKDSVRELLSGGDIDRPSQLVPRVLRAAPSLLRFSPQVLGSFLERGKGGSG
ncbi:MAG: geranylgeranyl reductase family protein [Methanomassiliicoccales archaeon]